MPTPIDRRLVRECRAARAQLALAGALGVAEAGLLVAQAILLATIIAAAAVGGAGVDRLQGDLIALGAVLAARALVTAGFELSGRLGAGRVMSELRGRLVRRLLLDAPGRRPLGRRTGELAADAVQGVDALEAYFASYLPQLVLASLVPVVVLAVVAVANPVSAVVLAVTIPILILFMVLIGKGTAAQTRKRAGALSLLSAHFLDVVSGLETLRAYRRERLQEHVLAEVGERYRRETIATLRIAFLSALVLELCAMLGTAVLAATIGVQLVGGHLSLQAGLTVLLLAPELYGPLRQVGQQFHASADGVAASEAIFEAIDARVPVASVTSPQPIPDISVHSVLLRGVVYRYPDRDVPALDGLSLGLYPRTLTALVGESGSGKSTIVNLLLRLDDPAEGALLCGGIDIREFELDAWRRQFAWVPQHPTLFGGTVADNVRLGAPATSDERVWEALRAAGAEEFVAALPEGLETVVGEGGRRLSAGQRQRIALARAFASPASVLVLDEPTAYLDDGTARAIANGIQRVARDRTTLLIVHDDALTQIADQVVRIGSGRIAPCPMLGEVAA